MDAERWKQVDELLQSALQVPSEQRDEFLRQACAGDAGLEQEVRSLLASDQSAGGFLQAPAIKAAAQMIALNEVREIVDVVLGQTISHYRVLKKLGSGGMGVVYEAKDIRLERHVALKLLLESEATNSKALQRFEQEARAISSLNHPNICTLFVSENNRTRGHAGDPDTSPLDNCRIANSDYFAAVIAAFFRAAVNSGRSSPTEIWTNSRKYRLATVALPLASAVLAAPYKALNRFGAIFRTASYSASAS